MGGLCALATFDGKPASSTALAAMVDAAVHRAPDGTSRWTGEGIALAHLALHVTPDDVRERQPVHDGHLICVADVRLDDRERLRAGVAAHGHLRSDDPTDGELILAAYRCWGEDCPRRLTGDFAFVIWDTQRRRLFAARDQMGARMLYHRVEAARRALLATELKQVLAAPGVPCEPHEAAIVADISGLRALPHMSPYAGIAKLPPAHALTIDGSGHRTWRYWDIDPSHRIRHPRDEDYVEEFQDLFVTAVRDRLRSHRPVGVMLSGGVKSMSAAGTASWLLQREVTRTPELRSYMWGFDELPDADERPVAHLLTDAHGLAAIDIPGDGVWPLAGLPAHAPDQDDPFAWLYQGLVDRTLAAAREDGIASLMTGDLGDAIVGGVVGFDDLGLLFRGRWLLLHSEYGHLRSQRGVSLGRYAVDRLAKPLFTFLWPPHGGGALRHRLRHRFGDTRTPPAPWVPPETARRVDLDALLEAADSTPPIRGHARLQRYHAVFNHGGLRIAELRQRTGAAAGVVHLDPWGDRRLAEFVCAVPQWHVQRRTAPRRLAYEAMRGILPEPARSQMRRHGPYSLVRRSYDEREVGTIRGLFTDSRAAAHGWLDAGEVLASYDAYLAGQGSRHDFWFPICVELWLRRWWD